MSTVSNLEDELALVSVNESNSSTYDILLKIMALGDTGVGKSCFLVQYVEGRFMMKYVTTVGVDFFLRKLVSRIPNEKMKHFTKTLKFEQLFFFNPFDNGSCFLLH